MILALPGLGADDTLFGQAWRELPDIFCISWPVDFVPDSVLGLAQWVHDQLLLRFGSLPQIEAIVGISMGGMVALELAPLVQCEPSYSVR